VLETQRRAYESVRQKWLLEAVKAYIAATKFRTYERMDAVLYRLIQLLASVGKDDQAREFFGRLQREYPKSSHLTAAKIALADAACGAGHLDDAVGLYEGVEQLPGERLGTYATYAKGWCYLDLGRTKEALESFVAVVMDSKPSILRGEAMRDLVRAYARSGSPERAWDFFEKVDPLAAASMMRSLIARYAAEGKPDDAARAAELARAHGVKADVSAPR
jgi:tetratricopeptide (TPR) repeat protein